MCGIYYGGADMTKRYNSVIGINASIDHDTPDGYDLTADDIRERLQERLNSVPDDELLEASGLTDTVDNKPEPDTRPFNVYKVTATEYVNWEVAVVARDVDEAYLQANEAAMDGGWFEKNESYDWTTHEPHEQPVWCNVKQPTSDPHVWVTEEGDCIAAYRTEVDDD